MKSIDSWASYQSAAELPDNDDDDYDRWLANCAAECECCSQCNECPCGGVMQGAWCDQMPCTCDEPREDDDAKD